MRLRTILLEVVSASFPIALSKFWKCCKNIFVWLFGGAGSTFSVKQNFISHPLLEWIPFTTNQHFNIGIHLALVFFIIFLLYQINIFIIECFRKYILISRESVYGNAIILLSHAFSTINENRDKDLNPEEVKTILKSFCISVQKIYEKKTKAKCHVSIKIFLGFNDNNQKVDFETEVKNLVRDDKSDKRDTPKYQSTRHRIANNTGYQRIIANFFEKKHKDLFFLSNDLPSIKGYENSSFEVHPDFDESIRSNEKSRRKNWPLDYKSELIVSLSPLYPKTENELPILGFLCIDCELDKREVFNKKYDVPLVRGIADGLHEFIKKNLFTDSVKILSSSEPNEDTDVDNDTSGTTASTN